MPVRYGLLNAIMLSNHRARMEKQEILTTGIEVLLLKLLSRVELSGVSILRCLQNKTAIINLESNQAYMSKET